MHSVRATTTTENMKTQNNDSNNTKSTYSSSGSSDNRPNYDLKTSKKRRKSHQTFVTDRHCNRPQEQSYIHRCNLQIFISRTGNKCKIDEILDIRDWINFDDKTFNIHLEDCTFGDELFSVLFKPKDKVVRIRIFTKIYTKARSAAI